MIAKRFSSRPADTPISILSNRWREGIPAPGRERKTGLDTRPNNEFLRRITNLIEANLADEYYGIRELCEDAGISRSKLHRKLKEFACRSASRFIRNIRLKKARTLLQRTDLNISEVAYEVGFGDPKYFSRVFSKEFNRSPRDFRDQFLGAAF